MNPLHHNNDESGRIQAEIEDIDKRIERLLKKKALLQTVLEMGTEEGNGRQPNEAIKKRERETSVGCSSDTYLEQRAVKRIKGTLSEVDSVCNREPEEDSSRSSDQVGGGRTSEHVDSYINCEGL